MSADDIRAAHAAELRDHPLKCCQWSDTDLTRHLLPIPESQLGDAGLPVVALRVGYTTDSGDPDPDADYFLWSTLTEDLLDEACEMSTHSDIFAVALYVPEEITPRAAWQHGVFVEF